MTSQTGMQHESPNAAGRSSDLKDGEKKQVFKAFLFCYKKQYMQEMFLEGDARTDGRKNMIRDQFWAQFYEGALRTRPHSEARH